MTQQRARHTRRQLECPATWVWPLRRTNPDAILRYCPSCDDYVEYFPGEYDDCINCRGATYQTRAQYESECESEL